MNFLTKERIVSSESVNIGHPDKTCDVIADAFLDEALRQDKDSMMAVECAIKNNKLFIYGEATTKAHIDYDSIARRVLREIGYTCQFDIIREISEQSIDLYSAVKREELCANDQGIVFGYATDETREYMPLPIILAHRIMQSYELFRKRSNVFFADAKCQVSVKYLGDTPTSVSKILLSCSHVAALDLDYIRDRIKKEVILPVLMERGIDYSSTEFIINPSGRFTIWGSMADSGCVGRKIVVDAYGSAGRVGGGAFSSKNATKVDRSGAYYARYVAKNIVAHGLAKRCEVALSFGIGLPRPLSMSIDTFSTETTSLDEIYAFVHNNFDFSLSNMIDELGLNCPIYQKTACYGHFGREDFPWEKIKKI